MEGAQRGKDEMKGGDIVVNIIKPIHNNHKFFLVERRKAKRNGKYLSIQSKICLPLRRHNEIHFGEFDFDLNLN